MSGFFGVEGQTEYLLRIRFGEGFLQKRTYSTVPDHLVDEELLFCRQGFGNRRERALGLCVFKKIFPAESDLTILLGCGADKLIVVHHLLGFLIVSRTVQVDIVMSSLAVPDIFELLILRSIVHA